MNKKFYIVIGALFLMLNLAVISSQAAPGELDITFGVNGKVTTSIGTNFRALANAVAFQADGKIVAAGYSLIGTDPNTSNNDFAVVRYNADGSLDTTFGSGGIVTTPIGIGNDTAFSAAIQSDGKIVVVGTTSDPNTSTSAFAIVRYNTNGGVWYLSNLTNPAQTPQTIQWGLSTDKLVPADYDGDGKTNFAVFRNGVWYILDSNLVTAQYISWGLSTDKLVPADYDGDGRADAAVFRDGIWHIQQSTAGNRVISFGLLTDIPIPTVYLP